jgi:serine/threonine-protein kinase SRPK3
MFGPYALAYSKYEPQSNFSNRSVAETRKASSVKWCECLESFPEPWWSEWDEQHQKYFDEDGEPRKDWTNDITLAVKFPLEDAIKDIGIGEKYGIDPDGKSTCYETDDWRPLKPPPRVDELEDRNFMNLLLKILRLKPEERVLAEALLRH